MASSQGRRPRGLAVPLEPAQVTPRSAGVADVSSGGIQTSPPGGLWRILVAFPFDSLTVQQCLHQRLLRFWCLRLIPCARPIVCFVTSLFLQISENPQVCVTLKQGQMSHKTSDQMKQQGFFVQPGG